MSIFTVIAIKNKEDIKRRIDTSYGDNYPIHNEHIWFVRSGDTASEIAATLGMDNEQKNTGVVVKNEIWNGYADVGLWDWGNKSE